MDKLLQELQATGWIHWPLPLHEEHSLEVLGQQKEVLQSRVLTWGTEQWNAVGECQIKNTSNGIHLTAPLAYERRPNGNLELGDCGNYGGFGALCTLSQENWEAFNRFSFDIKPQCQGIRKLSIQLCFCNEGAVKLPDCYFRDGFHNINCKLDEWNHIVVEIPSMPRDCITGVSIQFRASGCETDITLGNQLQATIGNILLECVQYPEITIGWQPSAEQIVYCFSGYQTTATKQAIVLRHAGEVFTLEDEIGQICLSGRTRETGFEELCVLDFSSICKPGHYRLCLGKIATDFFEIGKNVWLPSAWKTINFLFCERCGYPVPGIHQTCHRDVVAKHNGKSLTFNGGWHDAGDLSQQLIQSAEVTYSLFELAASLDDSQQALRIRLLEEARWGLDYILKSRFGDGYRATSIGTGMWSRGMMNDEDDISARLHNNAYENYLCAGVEAYCSGQLADDPGLAARVLDCAIADFDFAQKKFEITGFEERPPIYWEHSWMTPESTFMATASFAASCLLSRTGNQQYAEIATEKMRYVLACQQTTEAGSQFPLGGFFYRNIERKGIVHFNHQARNQIYAQALEAILCTQPQNENTAAWIQALAHHADYLQRLMEHASPYGMIPAGLYRIDEAEDKENFQRQHLQTGSEMYLNYEAQLHSGLDVGCGYYLRQFPVWFSFRGNNAVLLSMGKSASICGKVLGKQSLLDAAERQLAWNIGVNPFQQSMMYGEGIRYAQQYAAMSGEAVGELPVGVQTQGNEDAPYWPQMNNATYKEVWTTPAGRWLSILADLINTQQKPKCIDDFLHDKKRIFTEIQAGTGR